MTLSRHIHLTAPQLWKDTALVLTDSGGLQEQTAALGAPCITMRESTDRPVTVDEGTHHLAGTEMTTSVALALDILGKAGKLGRPRLPDQSDQSSRMKPGLTVLFLERPSQRRALPPRSAASDTASRPSVAMLTAGSGSMITNR